MLRAALRTALAHKGRLVLSTLAVVVGVAFVAGTYVFTDTLQRTFTDLFDASQPDVVVTPAAGTQPDSAPPQEAIEAGLPPEAVEVLADVEGVAKSGGSVQVTGVTLIGADGEAVGSFGPPSLGVAWLSDEDLSPLRLVEGRGPESAEEIAIDLQSFESGGFAVGDVVRVLTPGPTVEADLVGVFQYGASGSLAGATVTAFEASEAQTLLVDDGRWTAVQAIAEEGVSQDEIADRAERAFAGSAVGPVQVQTGEELEDQAAAQVNEGLTFFTTFLLVFAGVALFVGAFIIVNTFSVLIARRTRELALLRAVGASRRQVSRSVLAEAFLVGLTGGVVGLLLGILLAMGLRGLFAALGLDIPAGGLVVLPRTVVVAVLIGVGLTMAAAYFPARRAGRVPPVAALRDDVVLPARSLRRRTVSGSVVSLLGAGLLVLGLVADVAAPLIYVGLGILLVFVGVALLSAVIGGTVTGVLGLPFMGTTVGRLAVRNTQRDRRRTSATAGALMIGLALVTMIGVLGSSATRSIDATISAALRADFIVSGTSFQPFSPEVGDVLEDVPGVGIVARLGSSAIGLGADAEAPAQGEFGPDTVQATGIDPSTIEAVLALDIVEGDLASLVDGAAAVDTGTAETQGLALGDTITVVWPTGTREYEVGAVIGNAGQLTGVVVDRGELADLGLANQDITIYLNAADQVAAKDLRPELDAALEAYPVVSLLDQSEFSDQIRAQVNQLLSILYMLLAVAVVIAVLGIVNTLLLSVLERTREIGLLRAVGTGRGQVRRVVRIEALIIALFGAFLGVGLGLLFGVTIQQTLADDGITELGIPWTLIAVVLVVSALVGVLAAIIPARRAANLDVLAAISTE